MAAIARFRVLLIPRHRVVVYWSPVLLADADSLLDKLGGIEKRPLGSVWEFAQIGDQVLTISLYPPPGSKRNKYHLRAVFPRDLYRTS